MSLPTPVRFSDSSKENLTKLQASTGLKQADVIRLAVEEIFTKYPTDDKMIHAIILHRSIRAKKHTANAKKKSGGSTR